MLLPGALKNIFRANRAADLSPAAPSMSSSRKGFPSRRGGSHENSSTRPSRGLEEFFSYIRDQTGLTILDLGGATQKNVSFITELGHRLYSEDFLAILKETFGADDTV